MTKAKVGVVAAIVATTAFLPWQHHTRAQIQQKVSGLSLESGQLAERVATIRADNQRVAATQVDPAEVEMLRTQYSAVLRLRGQLGVLREQVQEAGFRSGRTTTQTPARPRRELEFLPRENWQDVGLQSPTQAVQTIFWAGREGAMERLKQAFFFGTNSPDILTSRFEEEFWKVNVTNNVGQWRDLAIQSIDSTAPDEVVVHTRQTLSDGSFVPTTVKLRNVDGEWRLPYEPYDNWPFGERTIPDLDLPASVPPESVNMPTILVSGDDMPTNRQNSSSRLYFTNVLQYPHGQGNP